jgi:hypothetical protein
MFFSQWRFNSRLIWTDSLLKQIHLIGTFYFLQVTLSMKNDVVWNVAQGWSCVNRRFGGTYRLHLQGRKIRERGSSLSRWLSLQPPTHAASSFADFSALKLEAIRSCETSVHTRSTLRPIPEDDILHSHRRENLRSYILYLQITSPRTRHNHQHSPQSERVVGYTTWRAYSFLSTVNYL